MATPPKKPKIQPQLLAGERLNSENEKAVLLCNQYLRMGIGRSLRVLAQNNSEEKQMVSLSTLMRWSAEFGWQARAIEYDTIQDEIHTQARNQAMLDGLALDYERVNKLKRLADFLEEQLFEQGETGTFHNVWLADIKQVGSGEFAERVDIERFNQGILSEYRAVLDDLAKETGGRIRKQEVTGKDGNSLQVTSVTVPAKDAHDAITILDELARLGAIPPKPSDPSDDPTPK